MKHMEHKLFGNIQSTIYKITVNFGNDGDRDIGSNASDDEIDYETK